MKNIYLGVLDKSAGYSNGGVWIGLYSGKDEDEAKQNMYDKLPSYLSNYTIIMTKINEAPVQIITHKSDYNDY